MSERWHWLVAIPLILLTLGRGDEAAAQAPSRAESLALLSIEELLNIQITSATRKEQRLEDVAAAVYVITQEDIRRSGMTTLPELFRLVPGMQVAQINANKWAIAIRGFNDVFADKVLVLVDGRTVYDRLNSGVFWESLDIPLDLIERIEVIRGPGGSTWGANAVNGVINVVTMTAADTPGASATVRAGTFDGLHASAHFGGRAGALAYRIHSQWSGHGQSRIDASTPGNDAWVSQTHGVRIDWSGGDDALMAQGGTTLSSSRGLFAAPRGPVPGVPLPWEERTDIHDYYALTRWSHQRSPAASFELQSFVNYHHNIDSVDPRQLLADVEGQYHTRLRQRHDVIVGGGYRFLSEQTARSYGFTIDPTDVREHIVNAFAQDEIALGRRTTVTLGAKVEHDPYTGWDVQPSARVMWALVPHRQHVWAALSRAVHTPSLADVSGRFNYASFVGEGGFPVVVGARGNRDYQSQEVISAETGIRFEIGSAASLDVTAFRASYDRLRTNEPEPPELEATPAPQHLFIPVRLANLLQATTHGVEIAARWKPLEWWRVEGGYSTFNLTPHLSAASRDTTAASFTGNAPAAQWQARSALSMAPRLQVDAMIFHVGALPGLDVPAYTRADARVEIALTRQLSASMVWQNLLDPEHAEYTGLDSLIAATRMPRSAQVQLRWQF